MRPVWPATRSTAMAVVAEPTKIREKRPGACERIEER
jgi:hypothetical protein